MGQAIFLRGARQLLSLRGPNGPRRGMALQDLGIIEDGSLLIQDGVITNVGSTRRIENLKEARGALEIRMQGKIVMPGLVDPSLTVDTDHRNVKGTTRRKTSAELQEDLLSLMRSCLQHGTLTAELKARPASLDRRSVSPALRVITKIGNNPITLSRTWQVDTQARPDEDLLACWEESLAYLVRHRYLDNVEWLVQTNHLEKANSLMETIRGAGLGIRVTWSGQSCEGMESFLRQAMPRSVRVPAQLPPESVSLLAAYPGLTVIAPGHEILDGASAGNSARRLVDAGAAIALSSGYDSQNPTSLSMQMALALAVIRLRLTPEEAISASTANAAHAAGCARRVGTLEVGKQADVLVMNVPDYREIAWKFGINHVGMVIRNGTLVFNRTQLRPGAR